MKFHLLYFAKHSLLVCFCLSTLHATTTFTIGSNLVYDANSGNELDWLNNNAVTTGSGLPYVIVVEAGAQWTIDATGFETQNIGSNVTIEILGATSYPTGGQLLFIGNGSQLIINGADAIYVSADNTNGLDVSTHVGHLKIKTDCEEFKGNQLGNIIAQGGVTGNCSPLPQAIQLPVEWVNFTAQLRNQQTVIKWETASEINNDYFVVEHSKDGIHFASIGEVMGSGTSNIENTYFFTHKTPAHGNNYYRVRQVDYDGSTNSTHVVSVKVERDGTAPNIRVSTNYLSIEQQDEETTPNTVFIFDMAGKQIAQFDVVPDQTTTFDTSGLTAGIYVVAMKNGGNNFLTRFFKS